MDAITKKIKYIIYSLLLFFITPVFAQVTHAPASTQLKSFYTTLAQADLSFAFPEGFKEVKVINSENLSFDYAMEIPGEEFEIWLQVKTEKDNEKYIADKNLHANPDSVYVDIAQNQASAFTDDKSYLERTIPPMILERYNADVGKSFLLNLNDTPITKHYKYALLIVLQKNHTGTILAVCFTNQKGPDFFKNVKKLSGSLRFKS